MAEQHILVVGGTGMLREVALHYAREGYVVSTIARHRRKLDELIEEAIAFPGEIHPLPLDYHNDETLRSSLEEVLAIHGPIGTVLSWIHSTAQDAPFHIAEVLGSRLNKVHYYDILGSSSGDPSDIHSDRPEQFKQYSAIHYHRVVLGWINEVHGKRWLTNEEISQGVIDAVSSGVEEHIIGTIKND